LQLIDVGLESKCEAERTPGSQTQGFAGPLSVIGPSIARGSMEGASPLVAKAVKTQQSPCRGRLRKWKGVMMSVDRDLYELNLTYLFKAREMALAGESHKASVILGISPDSVNRLSELSIEKIRTLAKSGVLCFQSRLPDEFWKDLHTSGF